MSGGPFRISLLIDADGKVAKAELRQLGDEAKKAAKATESLGETAQKAGSGVKAGGEASAKAGQQYRGAGQQVGNLTAQFNDLVVGVQMGQNPMQMAIQQGLQITQVFGQSGGANAVGLLKQAFLSMISPINLITIGTIAAGAAIANWVTDIDLGVQSVKDGIDDLATMVDAYGAAVERVGEKHSDLVARLGSVASGTREAQRWGVEVQQREISRQAASVLEGVVDEAVIGVDLKGRNRVRNRPDWFYPLETAYLDLEAVANASVNEQLAALDRLYVALEGAFLADGKIDGEENGRLIEILNLRGQLEKVAETDLALNRSKILQLGQLKAGYQDLIDAALEEASAAIDLLSTLEQQNEIKAATQRFGADSAQVARLKADAEREATEALIQSLDVTEDVKDQLRAAADEGHRLALLDIASPISAAAREANALASALSRAVSDLDAIVNQSVSDATLAQIRSETVGQPVERAARLAGARFDAANPGGFQPGSPEAMWAEAQRGVAVENARRTAQLNLETAAAEAELRDKRQSGGGSGARSESDAVNALITSLEDQLALIRETDPVQRAMLENREALAEATLAERAAVEELISERIAEQAQLEALEAARAEFSQTIYDSIHALVFEGESLLDVLGNIALKLAELALQAALLGEGPLGGLFGAAGKGGGLGMIFDGLASLLGFSEGGPTGGTDPRRVAGVVHEREFVFDAASTDRIGVHNLEAIRRGRLPGYATGGLVGARGPVSLTGQRAVSVAPQIIIENHTSAKVDGHVEEETGPSGQRAFRFVLADQMATALTQKGGGARKALRQSYGMRIQGTRR